MIRGIIYSVKIATLMLTIMKVGGGGGSEVAPTNLEIITDKIRSNSPVVSRANLYPFNWLEN